MKKNDGSFSEQLDTNIANLQYITNKYGDYEKVQTTVEELNSQVTDLHKKYESSSKHLSQVNEKIGKTESEIRNYVEPTLKTTSDVSKHFASIKNGIQKKEVEFSNKTKKLEKLKVIESLYALANKHESSSSITSLVKEACYLQDKKKFDSVLEKLLDVNIQDAKGKTPIILAVENKFSYGVEQLLKKGANLHIKDQYGDNGLHISIKLGCDNITKQLIEVNNSIIFYKNAQGKLPLYLALEQNNKLLLKQLFSPEIAADCLLEAIKTDAIKIAQDLVNMHPSIVHFMSADDKSVLGVALEQEAIQITKLLLSYKADMSEALDSNKSIKNINIADYPVENSQIKSLHFELLNYDNIIKLSLRNSQINPEQSKLLADGFKSNHSLKILDLSGNNLGYVGAKYIADTLVKNTGIISLDISRNNIEEAGAIFLANMLKVNNSLIALNLSNNNIKDVGVIFLSNNLASNKSLSYIALQYNNIGERGIEALSDLLLNNNTLTKLKIDGNNINYQGIEHIAKSMDINASIIMLSGIKGFPEAERLISDKLLQNIKQFEAHLQLIGKKSINYSELDANKLLSTLKQLQVQEDNFVLQPGASYKKVPLLKQLAILTHQIQEQFIDKNDDALVSLAGQVEQDQSFEYLEFV